MTSPDKLTIDTPEQLALDYPLAGVGSRFLALAVDTLIQSVVALGIMVSWMIFAAFGVVVRPGGIWWSVALVVIALFLIYFGYFAYFETIWNGQTPGKRRLQIRVIKDDGRPITVYDAVARNLLRLIDQLPAIYGVGILCVLLSRQNKRLGDYVAGTVVVHEQQLSGVETAWESAPPPPLTETAYDVSRLSPAEVELVTAFLERRTQLSFEVRQQAAEQIAERIGKTMEVPQEQRRSPEVFLESVLAQRRQQAHFQS